MRIYTTEIFLEKANKIHNFKYDYSNVNYKNSTVPVSIICEVHGEFQQKPNEHLTGRGCRKCSYIQRGNNRKSTTKDFIEKSQKIHNNFFDYSLVKYNGDKELVSIICPKHGVFKQRPNNHLNGQGCKKCAGLERGTTQEFINKAKIIHKEKYFYNKVNYINNKTKVIINCPIHGEFEQTPNRHLKGQGCFYCGNTISGQSHRSNLDSFISKANLIHNFEYNYDESIYINNRIKICIICPTHGKFFQIPNSHLSGQGCPICRRQQATQKLYGTTSEFTTQAKLIHGNTFGYENVNYINFETPISIVCARHGIFWQTPHNHLSGSGCPKCKESRGEKIIRECLSLKNIKFIGQKRFNKCRNKNPLPYDFALFNKNNR